MSKVPCKGVTLATSALLDQIKSIHGNGRQRQRVRTKSSKRQRARRDRRQCERPWSESRKRQRVGRERRGDDGVAYDPPAGYGDCAGNLAGLLVDGAGRYVL